MQLAFHQVDAFSDRPFGGNPAMVYRLDAWLADELMQKIAAEHNLAETAFLVRENQQWHIRWFTPTTEVPLCGHATLASAYVLFEIYKEASERLDFICKSGALSVTREGDRLWLDFPAIVPVELGASLAVQNALGVRGVGIGTGCP
jgi:PhzF family phenazine biosynthesis protein